MAVVVGVEFCLTPLVQERACAGAVMKARIRSKQNVHHLKYVGYRYQLKHVQREAQVFVVNAKEGRTKSMKGLLGTGLEKDEVDHYRLFCGLGRGGRESVVMCLGVFAMIWAWVDLGEHFEDG